MFLQYSWRKWGCELMPGLWINARPGFWPTDEGIWSEVIPKIMALKDTSLLCHPLPLSFEGFWWQLPNDYPRSVRAEVCIIKMTPVSWEWYKEVFHVLCLSESIFACSSHNPLEFTMQPALQAACTTKLKPALAWHAAALNPNSWATQCLDWENGMMCSYKGSGI